MPYTTEPKGAVAKNLNKGYGSESVKTERSNLMSDNPVAKDASGGRGSWMSKHSQSKMGGGSPLMTKEGHGDAEFSENHLPSGLHIDEIEPKMSMSKKMTEKPKEEA